MTAATSVGGAGVWHSARKLPEREGPHTPLTEEEAKVERGEVICPRSNSWTVAEPGLVLRLADAPQDRRLHEDRPSFLSS